MLMNHTNQTEDDLSCYSPSVVGYRYFAVVWGCAVTITGTLGNLMTILAFASDAHLRTRFNVLIVNLAVADLLYCTILQPISVDSYLHLRWRSGQLWCRIFGLLLLITNSVSIITLCLIAFSRYLLVAKRAMFDRIFSNQGLTLLLISVWALCLASYGPLWSVYMFVPQVCMCSFHQTRGRPYTTILLVVYFVGGLGCIGSFSILIYNHVRTASQALLQYRLSHQSSRRTQVSSSQGTCESGAESGMTNTFNTELSSQGEQTSEKSSQPEQSSITTSNPSFDTVSTPGSQTPPPKTAATTTFSSTASREDKEMMYVTHMCLAVFFCFAFCFAPILLLNLADKHVRAPQILYMICMNLTWLNSCINPMLYAAMNRRFRKAYEMLLTSAAAPLTYLWTLRQAKSS
ncbi:G-protein coupled receptor 84-like [Cheilinus undulatus]|uniref:G-protein coupled receptor 84-like n=1 Tax=Cheilinus undulatus TaxID=241271 RepID=UPI001BD42BB5|nr:G-protein coupled receptor 84-like [Cheilinus undulatus]